MENKYCIYVGTHRVKPGPKIACTCEQGMHVSSVHHDWGCPVHIDASKRLKLGHGGVR